MINILKLIFVFTFFAGDVNAGVLFKTLVKDLQVTDPSTRANLEVSTYSLNIEALDMGSVSSVKTIRLINDGTATLTNISVSAEGPITYNSSACAGTLYEGQTCEIFVQATPVQLGDYSGAIKITASSGTKFISIFGTTIGPELTIQPEFGNTSEFLGVPFDQAKVQDFTITNKGTGAARQFSIGLTGAQEYSIHGTTCGVLLPASTSCKVSIQFLPTSSSQVYGTINAVAMTGAESTLKLTGKGVPLLAMNIPFEQTFVDTISGATGLFSTMDGASNSGSFLYAPGVEGYSTLFSTSRDDANGAVKFSANSSLAFGTGDFTIELMANRTATNGSYSAGLLGISGPGGNILLAIDDTHSAWNALCFVIIGNTQYFFAEKQIGLNEWHSYKLVRSNGKLKMYIDNVLQNFYAYTFDANSYLKSVTNIGPSISSTTNYSGPAILTIGNQYYGSGVPRQFKGLIDSVKVYRSDVFR